VRTAGALLWFAVFWAAASIALAQTPAKIYRVGYLGDLSGTSGQNSDAFVKGLSDLGYVEGRNVVFERRSSGGKDDRYPALAAELVKAKVDVIFAPTTATVRALINAGAATPIVFAVSADPIGEKFVASLRRPGGNITGLTIIAGDLVAKRVDLLAQAYPKAARLGFLVSSISASRSEQMNEAKRAAGRLGKEMVLQEVVREEDIGPAIENLRKQRIDALLVSESIVAYRQRKRITDLVTAAGWPAIYPERAYAASGGLMSYGPSYADLYRRAAGLVVKILKGAKPGELPVEQPTVFELVVNLKAAKASGITVPQSITGRADHLIE